MKLIFALLLMGTLLSCSSSRKRVINDLHYSKDFSLSSVNIEGLFNEFRQVQVFTISYLDSNFSTPSALQYRNKTLRMYAYSIMGVSLFEAELKNGNLTYKSKSFLPKSLKPESILLDIVLIYADFEKLKTIFRGNVRAEEIENSRSIYVDGKKIISIQYLAEKKSAKEIIFENFQRKYKFKIQILNRGFDD